MSRRGSEPLRRALQRSVLSGWLSVAPGEVPLHRFLPGERPAVVLAVGEPVPSLPHRAAARRGGLQ
ncbi:MAG: hypothetical protein KQH83_02785 [Actinobacteria bacterium]|nr:hypothetical protein [Actinomycetota bacterium]